ncbi:MAG: aminotransferase class V-fold PLP-dependent enzyme, partial [Myxococcales bacterium]|nr:aminotransferase class V-fold PLP-dependent enzyme [Myxococcales bacterium]
TFRMEMSSLRAAIEDDRKAGYKPIAVVASAGTVNSGAIDPLDDVADLCQKESLWMHVDAAYGGPAILSASHKERMQGLVRADSVAVDPHKWMYVPVEAGLALVRDPEAMRRTFSLVPSYLQNPSSQVGGYPWFSEFGFQQTRGFRALKVWMVLQSMGKKGLQTAIERDIHHAHQLAKRIQSSPELELMAPQSLSIVCFRYAPPHLQGDEAALDRLNQSILARVQLSGEAFLTSTVLRGRFALRACFVNLRTTLTHVEGLVQAVCDAGELALSEP